MSRRIFSAVIVVILAATGGLVASSAPALEGGGVLESRSTVALPALSEVRSESTTYIADLPPSMVSIDVEKGIYYLGLGSGVLTSWQYGAKSTSQDGTLNQEFVVNLNKNQLKEFQAVGGDIGPITKRQAGVLSYYVIIYSQQLIISELEAGRLKPNITFSATLE